MIMSNLQQVECKSTITVRASSAGRKPPFNGSIFGKRSNWAPKFGSNEVTPASSLDSLPSGDDYIVPKLLQQQEALVEATVNHCLIAQQRSAGTYNRHHLLSWRFFSTIIYPRYFNLTSFSSNPNENLVTDSISSLLCDELLNLVISSAKGATNGRGENLNWFNQLATAE